MPRGKRTVFAMYCTTCNMRVGTVRLHKQKDGVSWKDHKFEKYCPTDRKRVATKQKEEKHSS
jgi:hypothetical protein